METDTLRWRQLVIDGGSWNQSGVITSSSGKKTACNIQVDTVKQILLIQNCRNAPGNYSLHYSKPDPDHIWLEGLWERDSIKVMMNKYDLDNYLLHKEGFKWIAY